MAYCPICAHSSDKKDNRCFANATVFVKNPYTGLFMNTYPNDETITKFLIKNMVGNMHL